METRKGNSKKLNTRISGAATLPADYTRMVSGVFEANFADGVRALTEIAGKKTYFIVRGAILPSEVVLTVSLVTEKQLAATTVTASFDFDPKASTPTAQDLLSLAVDGVGGLFDQFFDPKNTHLLEQLSAGSLAAFEDVPFEWTSVDFQNRKMFLKVDKSNPVLDELADDWLAKNDPKAKAEEDEFESGTEELFVTGDKAKRGGSQSH